MGKPKTPSQKAAYKRLNKRLSRYVAAVEDIYDNLNAEAAKAALRAGYTAEMAADGKAFRWEDYPQAKASIENLQAQYVSDMGALINRGTSVEWKTSNELQDLLATKAMSYYDAQISGIEQRVYYQKNNDALKAFQERKDKGMNLSEKLWEQSDDYRTGLEAAISTAIEKGTSAITLSKQISKYLQDFPLLKADYTEMFGHANNIHDCEYRSARLARSEINMAYRKAEQLRWSQMDFIVGYEIKTSAQHPAGDICNDLAGKYPKDFVWTGWHPNCMCYKIPIMKTDEEFWAYDGRGEADGASVNAVTEMPENFVKWVGENADRISEARQRGTLPYFIKDNRKVVDKILAPMPSNAAFAMTSLAKAINVDIGAPMSFEKADGKHPNPNYSKDRQYRINCQSCVVSYEMRRRGLPVEAYGNTKWSVPKMLSTKTSAAWIDDAGKLPKVTNVVNTSKKLGGKSATDSILEDFLSQTSEVGRYHFYWAWSSKPSGHIITMETLKDGSRIIYDPQSGVRYGDLSFLKRGNRAAFDLKRGIFFYRVDNLQPNTVMIKSVIKKSGSKAATPAATAEQCRWWAKNVEKADLSESNGFNREMLTTIKEIRKNHDLFQTREITEAANLQTGLLKRGSVSRKNLIEHLYSKGEIPAAEFAWENPEALRFVKRSELGEGKDLTNQIKKANIEKKIKRHVLHYNLYKFNFEGQIWYVKLEALENGAEQFYSLVK